MLNGEEKGFEELFYRALKDEGFGIPTTIEEVELAERIEAETDFKDLPTRLQDAAEILRQRKAFTLKFRKSAPEELSDAPLVARAARLGREIPEDVELRMRKDKAIAKNKSSA